MKTKKKWNYFKAEIIDNQVKTSGQNSCLLGYQYDISGYPKPGGVWARWEYKNNQLIIENDCLGFCPLYYYLDDKKIVVSNSILQIISVVGNVELDHDALRMMIRKRYFLQDKTAYKNISTLAPNTTIKWSKDKFEINSSFLEVKPQDLTHEQIVDGYIDLFKQSISRHLPQQDEDFIMPLSGGRDSRWMLMELLQRGFKPKVCVTCGEQRDIKLATQLCQRLDLNQICITPPHSWVKDAIRKDANISFSTPQHTWLVRLADYVKNAGCLSYDGNGIGMFSRNAYIDDNMEMFKLFRTLDFEGFENVMFSEDDPINHCIKQMPEEFNFLEKDTEDLKHIHYSELEKQKNYPNDLSAYSFYANTRTAISTCPFGMMRPAKIYFPFLDYELFSFIASLEAEKVAEIEPQAAAVRKAHPEIADIPFYNEIEFEAGPKASKLDKIKSLMTLTSYLAKYNKSSASKLISVNLTKKFKKKADYIVYTNRLLSLSMIKYCSKQENAKNMLNWVDKEELKNEKNI